MDPMPMLTRASCAVTFQKPVQPKPAQYCADNAIITRQAAMPPLLRIWGNVSIAPARKMLMGRGDFAAAIAASTKYRC